ncbi:MAG: calcium-binding protein [Tepidisphaeraceae bacterium]
MREPITPLEPRRLLAATASLVGTTLTITGTSVADVIYVNLAGNRIAVKLAANQPLATFPLASVKQIVANLGSGNDAFLPAANVPVPMKIAGGGDNDTLRGGAASDTLQGQSGDDRLLASPGNDVYSGGLENDTIDFSAATTAVHVSLDNVANDGPAGAHANVIDDVENILGGSSNDTLTGDNAANVIHGNGGNDTIAGADDTLPSFPGPDAIRPDTLYGDAGNDTLIANASRSVLHGGSGNDSVHAADSFYLPASLLLYGDGGDDNLQAVGLHATLDGGAGNDTLAVGSDGVAYGREGNDTLYSVAPGDTLYGGPGKDVLHTLGFTAVYARDGEVDRIYIDNARDLLLDRDPFDVLL